MKISLNRSLPVLLALAGVLLGQPAWSADARLKLPAFSNLEEKATETVNITLDSAMLGLAARFLSAEKPDEAAVKQLVQGLTGIYIKSFKFDSDFAYPKSDVDALLRQLTTPGWQRLVEVRSKRENSNVDIYLSMEKDRVNGLAIIAAEARELTIVNIVGSVDLEKLHQLEGHFGVPDLDLESGKKRATP